MLEPSCGAGALIDAAISAGAAIVVGFDIDPVAVEKSRRVGCIVGEADFSQVDIAPEFGRVVMNPPFALQIEHVRKAFTALRPGGRLAAIMSAGVSFRTDRKHAEFREWLEGLGGVMEPLVTVGSTKEIRNALWQASAMSGERYMPKREGVRKPAEHG